MPQCLPICMFIANYFLMMNYQPLNQVYFWHRILQLQIRFPNYQEGNFFVIHAVMYKNSHLSATSTNWILELSLLFANFQKNKCICQFHMHFFHNVFCLFFFCCGNKFSCIVEKGLEQRWNLVKCRYLPHPDTFKFPTFPIERMSVCMWLSHLQVWYQCLFSIQLAHRPPTIFVLCVQTRPSY